MATSTNLTQAEARFQLIDTSSERPDLARRREIKFAVPSADVTKLRQVLTGGSHRVAHNEAVSTVRSVYFDDYQLSACRANIDGLGRRCKLRIRWYDSLLPLQHFFVEVKWRDNRVTGKHRYQMHSTRPLGEISYRDIQAQLVDVLPPERVAIVLAYCEPIVLVEYKREHFHARDCDLRLTIDYEIAFYDQTGKSFLSTEFRQPFNDFVVVEGKTPVGRQRELRRVMYPFSARMTRCSKYVFGCQSLGLVSHL